MRRIMRFSAAGLLLLAHSATWAGSDRLQEGTAQEATTKPVTKAGADDQGGTGAGGGEPLAVESKDPAPANATDNANGSRNGRNVPGGH